MHCFWRWLLMLDPVGDEVLLLKGNRVESTIGV